MFALARRTAVALWVATVFSVGPALAQAQPPAPEDVTRVATAALRTLAETLVTVSGLELDRADFTAGSPEPVGPSGGQAEAHVLRFPDVRVTERDRFLSAASVDVIVLPLSDDMFEVRVQLPDLMDHLNHGIYLGALTIGEQTIRGVWSDSLRMFVELEVSLNDIRAAESSCDAACDARLADLDLSVIVPDSMGTSPYTDLTIRSFDWRHGLTEQEAGLWSGLVRLAVEDLVWDADEDWTARSIDQIALEANIRSADLSGIRHLADRMPDPDTLDPQDALAASRLLATIPPLLDGGSVTVRLNGFVLEPTNPAPTPGAEVSTDEWATNRLTVDRVGGRIAIDDLTSEASQIQISLAYSAPDLPDRQNTGLVDLVPETLSMALGVHRIPSEHAWQEIRSNLLAPVLLSQQQIGLPVLAGLIKLVATPEAHWSIGPVQADYADWALGVEGTMALTGPPLWEVTGGFDLHVQNVDQPLARLSDHPIPWLRERGLPIVQALRDIAPPGTEPDTLTVRIDIPEHGSVYLNGHDLTGMLE